MFDNYKRLDVEFPDSIFILTVRNSDDFYQSIKRWIKKRGAPTRLLYESIYGCDICEKNKIKIINQYEERNKNIIEYFAGKKNKLLVIDVSEGEAWMKLCHFLGKEVINGKFPHENINK